ncbi:hypothetical protein [Agrococcus sp. TF02-05]|uniref:hypothetical protein n=1 Tax=Agrococcus sp. TF02-05 TaxID=2815211 RepID=UPI001AA1CC52|nr:hypothetical protein [Agrococcus sp. TF02-05]MBO1770460.1 hypothetical protein [Agrococcus sp. TF02-05]
MTDPVIIDAGVVGFNRDERTAVGLVLPFGEECRSSVGRFTFDAGTVTVPQDVPGIVGFNLEHQRDQPIGRAVAIAETPQGLVGTFRIADGPEGDAALADIEAGTRKHLSAEVTGLRIKGGKALSAKLFGAALVAQPAFPSAALFAAADTDDSAPDTVESDEPAEEQPDEPEQAVTETTPDAPAPEDTEPAAPADPEEDDVATATAEGFAAAQPATTVQEPAVGLFALANAIVQARRTGNDRPLQQVVEQAERIGLFALADQTYDNAGDIASATNRVPQYLTDIWEGDLASGLTYSQYFDSGALTELTFKQRTVTQRPLVDKWSGNKTEIPSRKAAITTTEKSAQRFAGGLDIAREHYDFNKVEDVAFILQLMGESYRENSERYVGDELLAMATPLALPAADRPADIGEAHWKLVRGALAVIRQGKTLPTVAFVADDLYDEMLFAGKDSGLEYLQTSLGLTGGTLDNFAIVPDETLAAGSVLVGARRAAQVLTLPGSPIRVNALDIARGGVDEALFGYVGVRARRPEALQLVTTAAA